MLDLIFFSSEANSLAGAGCPCSAILNKIKQTVSKIRLEKMGYFTYILVLYLVKVRQHDPTNSVNGVPCVLYESMCRSPDSNLGPFVITTDQSPVTILLLHLILEKISRTKSQTAISYWRTQWSWPLFTVQYSSAVLVTLNNCHCFIGTNCPPWFFHLVGTVF